MTGTAGAKAGEKARTRADRARVPLLCLAGARAVLAVAAIPLAPVLYKDHFAVLVLMRPTKEVLMAGGFLIRSQGVNPILVVAAALPLLLPGVWLFYALGRSFENEIDEGSLPGLAGRLLPPERVDKLRRVLEKKGWRVVFLGRLAAFPSTMIAAAAGSSGLPSRRFLAADAAGAAASVVEVVGAGYLLGHAYKEAGRWITAVGVVVLAGLCVLLGRYLKRA